jgi:hypothetical protein
MNDLQYRIKKQNLKVIDLEGTVDDYKYDTTDNMIKILEDKISYNECIIEQFQAKGKDSSIIEKDLKEFKKARDTLQTWIGCL